MRDEIQAGLKNALERGSSLEDAIHSFISAGYNPVEVRAAANNISQGASTISQPQKPLFGVKPAQQQPVQPSPSQQPSSLSQNPQSQSPLSQPQQIPQQSAPKINYYQNVQQPSSGSGKIIALLIILIILIGAAAALLYFFGSDVLSLFRE